MGRRRHASLMIALCIAIAPSGAAAQRIVTPSSGIWSADTRGSAGTVAITGAVPRSGNGSLQLGVTGNLNDWAFFNLFAPNQTTGWGQLEDLTHVQFDWLRSAHTTTSDPVWEAQSPVLRLYIRSGLPTNPEYSELVWERWYNLTSPTPTGAWQTEDMTNQVFWRFVQGSGYTISDCTSPPGITPGIPIKTASPGAWSNGANCYLAGDAVVYGVSTDSEFVHLAWRQNHADLKALPFAMLADIKRELSQELGILDKGEGVCLRATFIVDPEGIIRFVSVNDLSVGRNPQEVLRVLDALQTDELCPCNWQKGDDVLKAA